MPTRIQQFGLTLWAMIFHCAVSAQEVLLDPQAGAVTAYQPTMIDIDFRRTEKGNGLATLAFSEPETAIRFEKAARTVQLFLPDISLTSDQLYTLDVVDFATHVTMVETFSQEQGSLVEFTLNNDYELDHY